MMVRCLACDDEHQLNSIMIRLAIKGGQEGDAITTGGTPVCLTDVVAAQVSREEELGEDK